MSSPTIETTNVNVAHLKNLSQRAYIGNYELDPHFLVLIFNLSQKNQSINSYLNKAQFFDASRMERLNIIKNVNFFNLLHNNEQRQLFPENIFNEIRNIAGKTTGILEENILYIKRNGHRFKNVHDYLKNNGFYSLAEVNPTPVIQLQNIINNNTFKTMLAQNSTPYNQYLQHVSSEYIKHQTETGVCIDISDTSNLNEISEKEAAEEGHWKLHISIDMKKNGQSKIDSTYNIVLTSMQKYNLVQLKVAAPYENVNSMKGKEFSIYLRDQMIVALSGSEENVKNFITETESLFIKNGIVPRDERDQANKPTSQQANKPTSQQANKPTSQQAN